MQAEAPRPAWNVPAGQSRHAAEPLLGVYVPSPQGRHCLGGVFFKDSYKHNRKCPPSVQPASSFALTCVGSVAPAYATTLPAAQGEHAAEPEYSERAEGNQKSGHEGECQWVLVSLKKIDIVGQWRGRGERAARLKEPGSQGAQTAKPLPPAYVPGGHGSQLCCPGEAAMEPAAQGMHSPVAMESAEPGRQRRATARLTEPAALTASACCTPLTREGHGTPVTPAPPVAAAAPDAPSSSPRMASAWKSVFLM